MKLFFNKIKKQNMEYGIWNMEGVRSKFQIQNSKFQTKGFILPFSMILTYIILIISLGVTDILAKEMFFSSVGRESQIAYYAADAGLDCAQYIDAAFVDPSTGIGIFPYDKTDGTWERGIISSMPYSGEGSYYNLGVDNNTSNNFMTAIKCAGSDIFTKYKDGNKQFANYVSTSETNGSVTTTFMLHMVQNRINKNDSCAEVSINKKKEVDETITRKIISRGYNVCDKNSPKFVERAIINTQ